MFEDGAMAGSEGDRVKRMRTDLRVYRDLNARSEVTGLLRRRYRI